VPVIEAIRDDLTEQRVDAIVNAANETLLGGGGVDGAIHRAAGPQLVAECQKLGACRPGEAKATSGYLLPARYVIHTVGPIWDGGTSGEEDVLRACHRNALAVAAGLGCRTIAFPAISCGLYGFPPELAAPVAVDAVRAHEPLELVRFVLFNEETFAAFSAAVAQAT
jgi:O-acetyl-ADP-ribose deacetylase (regulator of RNase III)